MACSAETAGSARRDGSAATARTARRGRSLNSKTLCPGTGRALTAPSSGSGICRGQGACRGSGTAPVRRLARSDGVSHSSFQYESDSQGPGSIRALGKNEIGNFGPARDRHVFRGRVQPPLLRFGRRRRPAQPWPAPRGRCDSLAPSAHAGFSARRRRFAPGCRAAAECLFPWPPAAASRVRRHARRKRAASRRPGNRRSRPGRPSRRHVPRSPSARARPGTRKNGAGAVPSPSAAVTDAMPSSISCSDAFDRQAVHAGRMILAVGGDGVAGVADLAHAFRIGLGLTADQEEGRLHALGGQDFQNPVAVARQRPVVEGQHHLAIRERQRFGILHGADAGMLARIDHQGSRGAERIGMAGAIGGQCGRRGDAGEQPQAQRRSGAERQPTHHQSCNTVIPIYADNYRRAVNAGLIARLSHIIPA